MRAKKFKRMRFERMFFIRMRPQTARLVALMALRREIGIGSSTRTAFYWRGVRLRALNVARNDGKIPTLPEFMFRFRLPKEAWKLWQKIGRETRREESK